MRTALAALALLTLAACDGSGSDDALVGTWTLTSLTSATRVTSRTAQTVPDRSATPTGSIAVTGATTATLGRVANLFADGDGHISLAVESADPLSTAGYVQMALLESATESQASLIDADGGLSYNAYFTPRRALVARSGGRFTVAPVTMTNGNVTATASGSLRYPEIALAAGQPTVIDQYEEEVTGTLRFVFEADGSFRATAFSPEDTQAATGTWERVGEDIRVTVRQGGMTETVLFRPTLASGTLELTATDVGDFCTGECVEFYEGQSFATPGSLTAVDFQSTFRFSNRTHASARAAEPAPTRPSRRASLPIVGPLLGR